jgi:hypothetical protein
MNHVVVDREQGDQFRSIHGRGLGIPLNLILEEDVMVTLF